MVTMFQIADTAIVVYEELIVGMYTAIPVGTIQGIVTVHQQERGIQIALDPFSVNRVVPLGKTFSYVIVCDVVILTGAKSSGVDLVKDLAVISKLSVYDRKQHRRSAVFDELAKTFLSGETAGLRFGGFLLPTLETAVNHLLYKDVGAEF